METFTMFEETKNTLNTPLTIEIFYVTPPSTIWDASNYICRNLRHISDYIIRTIPYCG